MTDFFVYINSSSSTCFYHITEEEIRNIANNLELGTEDWTLFQQLNAYHEQKCDEEGCQPHEVKILSSVEEVKSLILDMKNDLAVVETNFKKYLESKGE